MIPYPWQMPLWQALADRRAHDRMPHALLLEGPASLGKLHFAHCLARALLCAAPTDLGTACGRCRSCQLVEAGSHSDLLVVEPEAPGKQIVVDQIRQVGEFQVLTRKHGPYKVIIIAPAESMNANAANSLLKNLEEPTPKTVLALIAQHSAQLPATVRSRCQRVSFVIPPREQARAWLAQQLADPSQADLLLTLAQGAPLAARALAEGDTLAQRAEIFGHWMRLATGQVSPLAVASEYLKRDLRQVLSWCLGWTADLVRLRAAGTAAVLQNPDLRAPLQDLVNQLDLPQLLEFYERVRNALRLVPTSVNDQLLIEDLLLTWAAGMRNTAVPDPTAERRAFHT